MSTETKVWLAIGFLGQALFTGRMLVQWIASEKKRDSVIPVAFWWLSVAGALLLLSYAVYRQDPVIILGQGLGVFIYLRNLMLMGQSKKRKVRHVASPAHPQPYPRPHFNRMRGRTSPAQ